MFTYEIDNDRIKKILIEHAGKEVHEHLAEYVRERIVPMLQKAFEVAAENFALDFVVDAELAGTYASSDERMKRRDAWRQLLGFTSPPPKVEPQEIEAEDMAF